MADGTHPTTALPAGHDLPVGRYWLAITPSASSGSGSTARQPQPQPLDAAGRAVAFKAFQAFSGSGARSARVRW